LKLEFAAETAQKTHESRWNHEKDWKNKEMEMKREAELEIQKRESQYPKIKNERNDSKYTCHYITGQNESNYSHIIYRIRCISASCKSFGSEF
jgi:hypothetical protein